jgi:hypothetical protein
LNRKGLVISKKNHGWITIESKTKAKKVVNGEFSISSDGEIAGTLGVVSHGYEAYDVRKDLLEKGNEDFTKGLFANEQVQIDKSEFENIRDLDKYTKTNYEVIFKDQTSASGDILYIKPFVLIKTSNPFKADKRMYAIDYKTPVEVLYLCKFTLPDGYEVDELPQNKIIALPGNSAKYTFNISQTARHINLLSSLQINRPVFTEDEYFDLKEFYNRVVAKQSEQIVLKKIK